MSRTVLVIDDQQEVLDWIQRLFERAGWSTATADSGERALEMLASKRADVVVQDLRMPGVAGLDLLQALLRADPHVAVIVVTGYGDIATGVEAMQTGAESFLVKPLNEDQLLAVAERAQDKVELRRLMATTEEAVLLQGEAGTGKSWLARLIHSTSPRAHGPFVEMDCRATPPADQRRHLFGDNGGLVQRASGGTLVLDRVGDLAPELQPDLLALLETGKVRATPDSPERAADARLIAATDRSLEEDVRAGRFRADLFARLSAVPFRLPPLRERDPAQLDRVILEHLHDVQATLGRGPGRISREALAVLARQPWPGNLRDLRAVLQQCLLAAPSADELHVEHLPPGMR